MRNHHRLRIPAVCLAAITASATPTITMQPADQTANQGFSAAFTVNATTTSPPLSYLWFFASNGIPGAITNVLTIVNAQPADAGQYFVVVSDSVGSTTSRVATLMVVPPVELDPKLSANIRLGEDPPQLPANRRAQTEPHIARSYVNPDLLVATFMEGTAQPAALAYGYSVSSDGGMTWSRALIPGLTTLSGGQHELVADGVAAVDLSGKLLFTSISGSSGPELLTFSQAENAGSAFELPMALFRRDSNYQPEKNWIAVNTFPESPNAGRIAVAFTREGGANQSFLIFSDDGGATWSNPAAAGSNQAIGDQVLFLPTGELVILYWRYLSGWHVNFNNSLIEMVRSKDGGRTFEPPVLVQDMRGRFYNAPIVFDGSDLPSACIDRQVGVIYLTYTALMGPATNQIPSIMFTKSIDKGETWSTPVAVNDTPALRPVFNPVIAASPDGQHLTIAFYDMRNQTATSAGYSTDYYLAESFDGGDTWEPNLRLTEFSSDVRKAVSHSSGWWFGDYQGIVPALNFDAPGVAIWIDTRDGNSDPYVVRINRSKGTAFETWRKLRFSTNDLADADISGENADSDDDGIPNLAEYAFGLEPTHADAGPLKIFRSHSRPDATVTVSYEKLAVLGDIAVFWESSSNLVDWIPAQPLNEMTANGSDPSKLAVTSSFSAETNGMRFFRLAVAKTNPTPAKADSLQLHGCTLTP